MTKLFFTLLFISIIGSAFSQVSDKNHNKQSNSAYTKEVITLVVEKLEQGNYTEVIEETDMAIIVFQNENENQSVSLLYYYRGVAKANLQDYKGAIEDLNISIGSNSSLPKQAIANVDRKIKEYEVLLQKQLKRLQAIEDSIASVEIDSDIKIVEEVKIDANITQESLNNIIEIFDISAVDLKPEYPGGDRAMYEFAKSSIIYPYQSVYDTVYGIVNIQFVIDTNGTVTEVKVVKGLGEYLNNEAVRIIKSMPKWKPGIKEGKIVKVKNNIPIYFDLNNYTIDSSEFDRFSQLIACNLENKNYTEVIEASEKIIQIIEREQTNKSASIFYFYKGEAKANLNDYEGAVSNLKLALSTYKGIPKDGLIKIRTKLKQYQDVLLVQAELLKAKEDSLVLLNTYTEKVEKVINNVEIENIEYTIVRVSDIVGDTIDIDEKSKYRLFPQFSTQSFKSVSYLKDSVNNVFLELTLKDNSTEIMPYSYEQIGQDGGQIIYNGTFANNTGNVIDIDNANDKLFVINTNNNRKLRIKKNSYFYIKINNSTGNLGVNLLGSKEKHRGFVFVKVKNIFINNSTLLLEKQDDYGVDILVSFDDIMVVKQNTFESALLKSMTWRTPLGMFLIPIATMPILIYNLTFNKKTFDMTNGSKFIIKS